jgi:hypothetical protein
MPSFSKGFQIKIIFKFEVIYNRTSHVRATFASRRLGLESRGCYGNMTTQHKEENKMAASDVDVTSSIDQNEDRIEELTDEELYNLVEETL